MLWGAMSWYGLSSLVVVNGSINSEQYCSILEAGGVHFYQNAATSENRTLGQEVLFQFRALYIILISYIITFFPEIGASSLSSSLSLVVLEQEDFQHFGNSDVRKFISHLGMRQYSN